MKLYAKEMRRYNAELALYNKQKTEYDNEVERASANEKYSQNTWKVHN